MSELRKYDVFYMRPEFFRSGILGVDTLLGMGQMPVAPFDKTHIFLRTIEAVSKEHAFTIMQAEVWSPNGEARDLIERKGLAHTSMSVGDILIDEDEVAWMVDHFDWHRLTELETA